MLLSTIYQMKKNTKLLILIIIPVIVLVIVCISILKSEKQEICIKQPFGTVIDNYNGVKVYYNGSGHAKGRNLSSDGYNFGLKYECIEFVKRYYYIHLHHKMPVTSGNAKDFYKKGLEDGQRNLQRNLIQYSNPSKTKPKVDDLIIFPANKLNQFGHVAIISKVTNDGIEVVQQNTVSTRSSFALFETEKGWKVTGNSEGWVQVSCLGWLRKES